MDLVSHANVEIGGKMANGKLTVTATFHPT